ncbi:hypothetical protein BZA70DRAFT_284351 [Myxozyma melibiosi]|uniref:Cytochrome c oxidase assembly protein n=1 Tax=Myxozyma melibiosi TaxID=54550 RepID=A0ABR1EZC5_9ASCO
MSTASKITLGTVSVLTAGIIYGVHYIQKAEEYTMYQGVVYDQERRRIKEERMAELKMQQALQKEYEAVQPVDRTPKPSSEEKRN